MKWYGGARFQHLYLQIFTEILEKKFCVNKFHKHYTNDLYFYLQNIFRYLNINKNKSLDTLDLWLASTFDDFCTY